MNCRISPDKNCLWEDSLCLFLKKNTSQSKKANKEAVNVTDQK